MLAESECWPRVKKGVVKEVAGYLNPYKE